MRPRHGAGGLDMGMLMLAMNVARVGVDNIGPVTMAILGINTALFYIDLSELGIPTMLQEVCIGANHVWYGHQYARLLWASLFHANSMHLMYNMSSLLLKGRLLEPVMGTAPFAWLVFTFALCTSCLMVIASVLLDSHMPDQHLMNTCAVGFSGVLFALNTILPYVIVHPEQSNVWGFPIPTKYVTIAELVLISVLVPNASFLGHLCGIGKCWMCWFEVI
jgi:rhomboid domain-containing protein 1